MIGVNTLKTKVLITTDEVIFHAPTDHEVDPRILMQSIIVAERRFIKSMLGYEIYNTLIAVKNKLVTEENKTDLQTAVNAGRPTDREQIVLNIGDYVNSDTYLSAEQLLLWQNYLHKITAECVYLSAIVVNRARFGSKGVVKNYPESIASSQDSVSVDLEDMKHLLDKVRLERVQPLIEDQHKYLCYTKFPGYKKDCGCDTKGVAYKTQGPVATSMYDDDDENCNCKNIGGRFQ